MKNTLIIIPARGGSKGIPGKNIKSLAGKPLIQYTIEVARQLTNDGHICVSTDDKEIKNITEGLGLSVPFLRPPELATDKAGSYEVLLHALDFYAAQGKKYETLLLLQPTSPFRTANHIREAMQFYSTDIDMVTSVKISHASPYFTLMEEDNGGWLQKSKPVHFVRRQDAPEVYELNGALYIINTASLRKGPISAFTRVKKYVMEDAYSVDIDTPLDWLWAETLIENGIVKR